MNSSDSSLSNAFEEITVEYKTAGKNQDNPFGQQRVSDERSPGSHEVLYYVAGLGGRQSLGTRRNDENIDGLCDFHQEVTGCICVAGMKGSQILQDTEDGRGSDINLGKFNGRVCEWMERLT